ncbi:MAG TPA: carboxypeptidase regulatory-like domain-containing protein [Oscillatoriaceae cyanobacterium]
MNRLQQAAGLVLGLALLSTTGCGKAPLMQALPAGNEDALLTPQGGYMNQLPTGTVTGRVVDVQSKVGVPNVAVSVENVNPPVTAMTDSSGNFVLNNVPQGKQIVVLNRPGYVYLSTQGSIIADVMPNQTISLPEIDLTPQVAAASNAFVTSIGGLVEPYGLAVDNNHGVLYAVDRIGLNSVLDKRSEVKKFNLTGGFVSHFGGKLVNMDKGADSGLFSFFTHLSWAYGIDVDAGGNVYVTDTNNDRVVKFGSDGSYITKFNSGLSNPYDLAVLTTGQVAVSSAGNSKVAMFGVDLTPDTADFAGTENMPSTNGGFRGITVDNANFVYLLDNSAGPGGAVKKFDLNASQPVLEFGTNSGAGPGQFQGATDLAVDNRNGDIYVVDSGNNRVERFDRDGRFISEFGSAGRAQGQFDRPYGIAIDKNGYIYVSDTGNKRIEKFAPGQIFDTNTGNDVYYPTK